MCFFAVGFEVGFEKTQRVDPAPQRLQMHARCWVLRTGTFLNMAEINIFMGWLLFPCSSDVCPLSNGGASRVGLAETPVITRAYVHFCVIYTNPAAGLQLAPKTIFVQQWPALYEELP